ncbi:MAG: hypothetical protein JNN15_19450, partial [Blastocatellia bacterium]|nr:hypothetical protein [Blastocatellia bacterium]
MDNMHGHVRNTLQKHLKGITGSALENLSSKLGLIQSDKTLQILDSGIGVASVSLRAAMEFFINAPEVSRLISGDDLRTWGEIGRRFASNSPDSAIDFFQNSAKIVSQISTSFHTSLLTLTFRQAGLSTSLALECFKSLPEIFSELEKESITLQVLEIAYEIAQHSVKHSCDFLKAAPKVIKYLEKLDQLDQKEISTEQTITFTDRMLEITKTFVFRSGNTAAEFFISLPEVLTPETRYCWPQLFDYTNRFLEKSGGIAYQYLRAAAKVLEIANSAAFEKWTQLTIAIASQGNATGYNFLKISPRILSSLTKSAEKERNSFVINQVLEVVNQICQTNPTSAVECFKASPYALNSASIEQFKQWALNGLTLYAKEPRKAQAYYALESQSSRRFLSSGDSGITLESISQTLRLYVEGLTGKQMMIKPVSEVADEHKIGDGQTIYLPNSISEFNDEKSNFKLYKALAAHAAGQVEFGTYTKNSPELLAVPAEISSRMALTAQQHTSQDINFLDILS